MDDKDPAPNDPECWELPCKDGVWNTLDKVHKPLPEQGYHGRDVQHKDKHTWTEDWQSEWDQNDESERETISRVCKDHPSSEWCKRFMQFDKTF